MEISLKNELMKALSDLGMLPLKPVQEAVIPPFLAGKNLLVQAETGAGKTAAFLLPLLQMTDPFKDQGKALIIAPTRELALQIQETAEQLSAYVPIHTALLIGGIEPRRQELHMKQRPQILIGTPGRILYMIREKQLDLSALVVLVLDEADQILSSGQADELYEILKAVDHPVQTVCLSASADDTVRSYLSEPYEEILLSKAEVRTGITSFYCLCEDRYAALSAILRQQPVASAIIFVNYRHETGELAARLKQEGWLAEAFSSDDPEKVRLRTIRRFKEGKIRLLVATDAAARGLDIYDLSHIIHYHLPADRNTLIHRSGRTGHQGQEGTVILLLSKEELSAFCREYEPLPKGSGNPHDLTVPLTTKNMPSVSAVKLRINAGRDDRLRPGDIAGAFSQLVPFETIGRITVNDHDSTVILAEDPGISEIMIKGKKRKVRLS